VNELLGSNIKSYLYDSLHQKKFASLALAKQILMRNWSVPVDCLNTLSYEIPFNVTTVMPPEQRAQRARAGAQNRTQTRAAPTVEAAGVAVAAATIEVGKHKRNAKKKDEALVAI